MSAIRKILPFVHEFVHDLAKKKQYSEPKIYDAGGEISRRWYVYYSFRNPATGHLTRQDNIDTGVNEHKNVKDRYKAIRMLQKAISQILADGFNPYRPETNIEKPAVANEVNTITEAIEFALKISKKLYAETSYNDFKSRLTQFKEWLIKTAYGNHKIEDITQRQIIDFLNVVLQRSSARNRNNSRTAISGFYKILKDNMLVPTNLVDGINILIAKPEKNKSFTVEQEEIVLDKIMERRPQLGLFIGFISINLLRPIEICRLHVEDISIKDRVLRVKAKNQKLKTKIIPDLLLRELPDLSRFDRKDLLFTPTGIGQWDTGEVNRRNYFSDAFKEIKDELGLGKEYGLYSFRHTYILKLYRELRKEYTPFETKSRLMLITGHTSMKALEAYLRDIDAELPEDYSKMLITANKKSPG